VIGSGLDQGVGSVCHVFLSGAAWIRLSLLPGVWLFCKADGVAIQECSERTLMTGAPVRALRQK
jgi:hypothetical protein